MEGATFYGVIVKPGKKVVYAPSSNKENKLHLSQATLGSSTLRGERVVLKCRRRDEGNEDLFLCSMISGKTETCPLDLVFDEFVEFSIEGSTEIHLTGYYLAFDNEESDSDPALGYNHIRRLGNREYAGSSEDDDDDDDYDDSDSYDFSDYDDDDDVMEFMSSDSEDDDEEGFTSSDSESLNREYNEHTLIKELENSKPEGKDYIIEEITEPKDSASPKKGKNSIAKAESGKRAAGTPEKEPPRKRDKSSKASSSEKGGEGKSSRVDTEKDAEVPKKGKGKSSTREQENKGKQAKNPEENKGKSAKKNDDGKSSKQDITRYPSGLEVIQTAYGNGKLSKMGKRAFVKYVGRLKSSGQVFDKADKKPFSFRLGVGEVIQGWDVGVKGMRVGDKRRITVPPELGYGNKRCGPIPKNSWLVFDVELVDVK